MKTNYLVVSLVTVIIIVLVLLVRLSKNVEIEDIKKFEYNYQTGNAQNDYVRYKIDCKDKCIIKIKKDNNEEENTIEVSKETIDGLKLILKKYSVGRWDGFNKNNKHVKDGSSFSLYIKMNNNKKISAHGYMKYPHNYTLVKEEIDEYFNSLIK